MWRSTPDQKPLLSLESSKATVHLYDAEPTDLQQLSDAIAEVLNILEDRLPPKQSSPASL